MNAIKATLLCCLVWFFSTGLVEGFVDGEVVLTGTSIGAVQIYLGDGSGWASLCYDSFWNDLDARVVCRQLGYENGSALLYISPSWEYIPSLHVYGVECDMYDYSLGDCRFNITYASCTSEPGYAGVDCVSTGWTSSLYIGIIVLIFALAACCSFAFRILCGNKERTRSGWSQYLLLSRNRVSQSRTARSARVSGSCEDEEFLCREPEDPKLTSPAPPSYSDAVGLSQIPPPSYSTTTLEEEQEADLVASPQTLANGPSDSNSCLPPSYSSLVTSDSVPPSNSNVTVV